MILNQSTEELEIGKIHNIKLINSYGIINKKTGICDIMAILVIYEGGMLNYSELDKEFPYFYDTIRRVYNEEKENDISIDEETKKVLELNENLNLSEIYNKFGLNIENIDDVTTLAKKADGDYNIIKYVYESLLSLFNKKIIVNNIKGVGKNLCLQYNENGINEFKAFEIIESEAGIRTYIFPGIFEDRKELFITINTNNGLKIEFYDRNKNMFGNIEVNDDKHSIKTEVSINGKVLYLKTDSLELLDQTPYDDLLLKYGISGSKYKLPWNNIRIYDGKIKEDEEGITYSLNRISSLDINKDGRHLRLIINDIETLNMENYRYMKGTMKLKKIDETSVTDIYVIGEEKHFAVAETIFLPSILARGIYKSNLANRRFYKIYKLKSLELKDLTELEIEASNIKRYQLLKESELRFITKRGEK